MFPQLSSFTVVSAAHLTRFFKYVTRFFPTKPAVPLNLLGLFFLKYTRSMRSQYSTVYNFKTLKSCCLLPCETYSRFIKQLFYTFKNRSFPFENSVPSSTEVFHIGFHILLRLVPTIIEIWTKCATRSFLLLVIAANATDGKVCCSISVQLIYVHSYTVCRDHCMAKWSLSSSLFSAYP